MIEPLAPLPKIELIKMPSSQTGKPAPENGFSAFLKEAVDKLEQTQIEAGQAAKALVTGEIEDFHTPVIAMEKASLALGMAVTVRNKVLEAYHEIMRMQI